MPTESSEWEILEGALQSTESTIILVDAGTTGDPTAKRTLTHPDGANFPVVTYNRNPDRTINFDQVPLYPPAAEIVRTLGTSLAFVTQNALGDVIVTEIWEASGGKASMEASLFRRLYELSINEPAVEDPEIFIEWAPRDRTDTVYQVVIVGLRAGGANFKLDVREFGTDQLSGLDAVPTGILDKTIELDLLLVAEV